MAEKISIIVPVYKVEKELKRCVNSLLMQTYPNIEIMLVDDGSPDGCPQLCDNFALQDNRVKVIHKKNGGLSDARNVGLKHATGEYILYVDSDDYIELDSCQRFIEAIAGEKIDIIVGNAIMEKKNGYEMMFHSSLQSGMTYNSKDYIIKNIKAYQWYAPAWLNMYRKDFLIKNNLFFKKNIYFEDVQMLPRVFLAAKRIACIDGLFYHYIVRDNSIMQSEKNSKKKHDAIQNYIEWKKQFDNIKDDELQRYLYGMLLKCYLHDCRVYNITVWKIKGITLRFLIKYSLNFKERVKTLVFSVFPNFYVKMKKDINA